MKLALWVTVVSLVLAACKPSGPPTKTPTQSAPGPTDVVAVGRGFYIDVPKWSARDRGDNVGLVALYNWGGQGERSVKGIDGGTYWRVAFPDKPGATEVARL